MTAKSRMPSKGSQIENKVRVLARLHNVETVFYGHHDGYNIHIEAARGSGLCFRTWTEAFKHLVQHGATQIDPSRD